VPAPTDDSTGKAPARVALTVQVFFDPRLPDEEDFVAVIVKLRLSLKK
jgi:hypothetical protein